MSAIHPSLTIRSARGSDGPALERLASLDSQKVPAGEVLVATSGDELIAAYGIERGQRVGDPFRLTADVLDLLELHAHRREPRHSARSHGARWRPALRFHLA
jgi:hypothetical protein